jgi:glycosyltransferase involved in cell wall biosynthesis
MCSSVPKPKILVLLGCYLPGFRSGGPVRTISCMVEALAPYFDFRIVTLNHDSGSKEKYDSVRTNSWNELGSASVYYTPGWSLSQIRRLAKEVEPDLIYLNGFFATSSIHGLLARKLGMLPRVPFVLATRGDLAGGALGLKTPKKRAFMFMARAFGIYNGLQWHASSDREKAEMLAQLRAFNVKSGEIAIAPDLGLGSVPALATRPEKRPGVARFVTLSRITKMKNLPFTLDRLAELQGEVTLDIFGPVEDQELWSECEGKIATLPANVSVKYMGAVEPGRVLSEMTQRHFFILPTLGENYGHVVVEAAASGCPVVISDRTQWSDIRRKKVGWDIPLEDPAAWRSVLQSCIDMNDEQYQEMAESASKFGRSIMESQENLEANVDLFRRAIDADTPSITGAFSKGAVR